MDNNKNVFDNVLQLVGNTPLIKLNRMTANFDGDFYALHRLILDLKLQME